tara:strand:+ start:128 stop:409 length:282 start_codon:yes stop_codon:yes gene_type:complete
MKMDNNEIWLKSITPKGDLSWYIKWVSSVIIIVGMIMSSVNFFPYNLFVHFIGVGGWFVVGLLWNDRALVLLNGIAMVIFSIGIMNHYFGGAY